MSKEIELLISHDVKTGKTTTYDYRFGKVRELVKDGSLRVTDIAKQTGYNKGHVSRLRKEATKKEWVGLTDEEIAQGPQEVLPVLYGRWGWAEKEAFEAVVAWAEAKLKEKNT